MITKIQPEHASPICQLYQQGFHQTMSPQVFQWLYFDNALGQNYSRALHHNGQPVAFWGSIPLTVQWNGLSRLGCTSFQLVSNGQVPGATLWLWRDIKADVDKAGVCLNYNFHNDQSKPLLESLGWISVATPVLFSAVRPMKLLTDFLKSSWIKKILALIPSLLDKGHAVWRALFQRADPGITEENRLGEDYTAVWDKMSRHMPWGVVLNQDYMNWRYARKPGHAYRILACRENGVPKGYIVYSLREVSQTTIGVILDIIADPTDYATVKRLMKAVKREVFRKGATLLSALSFPSNMFYPALKKELFFKLPEGIKKRIKGENSYFALKIFDDKAAGCGIDAFHISYGLHENW